MKREEIIAKVEAIAGNIAVSRDIEIVEVELKGSGKNQLLRIYIDKPEGVTHTDCEFVSREVSAALDADDPFPGAWELEVSSPGLERKLDKWKDWQRFTGKKVTVVLNAPPVIEPSTPPVPAHFDGLLASAEDNIISVELADGRRIQFPPGQVSRANLKFEW
jgi:ribosome maturation factor RimP